MTTFQIVLIISGAITLFALILVGVYALIHRNELEKKYWWLFIFALFIIPAALLYALISLFEYGGHLHNVWKVGGFKKYRQLQEKKKKGEEAYWAEQKKIKEEHERIKKAYLNGEISKLELPRQVDGNETFAFDEEMGLSTNYDADVKAIVYVENHYCKSLNDFFIRHKDLQLYNKYNFIYLPVLCKDLNDSNLLRYLLPDTPPDAEKVLDVDSTYPTNYLWYPEDKNKIKHGMMFFVGGCENHGAKYIKGHYYHLDEGSDDDVINQLNEIVHKIHEECNPGVLCCIEEKPSISEGSTDEYADELFNWVLADDEVSILVDEVRERIKKLKDKGLNDELLAKLFRPKPILSRLLITKDMRILLPDYQNMEIKMEPINKAVYLLFLRHPEGIVFKHLPDYRKELAEIYQKIKPFGLNDRVLQSIEDVTNPCLNSINEKCARIRGSFVSRFDGSLAQNYYIFGFRGEPKKISLPQELVIWE